jgi:hypothetical protein
LLWGVFLVMLSLRLRAAKNAPAQPAAAESAEAADTSDSLVASS